MAALTTAPTNRAREYETIYILRSDVDPDAAERVAARVAEVIEREQGKLLKVENWGRRKLAYEINRQKRGVYTFIKYIGGGSLVRELERNLRLIDVVIRHQTVLNKTDIVVENVAIDPEETKFSRVELPTEADVDDSKEKALGFIDSPEDKPRRRDNEFDDYDDYNSPNLNPDIAEREGDK